MGRRIDAATESCNNLHEGFMLVAARLGQCSEIRGRTDADLSSI